MGRGARSVFDRLVAVACAASVALVFNVATVENSSAGPGDRALNLYNVNTKERATITFKRGGRFDRAGLKQVNHFLRDWRRNEPTEMDPQVIDLLWQAYQESGSNDYIHIVSAYRSPTTNGELRRRSSGVAKNSQHMQGKAIDFFIPGVDVSKLRSIGLRMQAGGVGFYPSSRLPFVHLDTGSVRHWPAMTRQQLVAVFPKGGTIHVPSDGKPLPGYNEALAAYKARKASGNVAVANLAPERAAPATTNEPIVLAAANQAEVEQPAAPPRRAVAVTNYATTPPPLPRLAPRRAAPAPVVVATAAAPVAVPVPAPAPTFDQLSLVALIAADEPRTGSLAPDFDFGPPQDWTAPAVPAALAKAMAERDQARRGSSLPIPPTAVVATIDMSRPLRAAAMTTAVLRRGDQPADTVPQVLAYAAVEMPAEPTPRPRVMTASGMPMPTLSPRHAVARATASTARPVEPTPAPVKATPASLLTMTALDTQGLRLWIGAASTRQKAYALLTMPDYAHTPDLMAKPVVSYGAGFGQHAYAGLRTDRFAGSLVEQPDMVDLSLQPLIASVR